MKTKFVFLQIFCSVVFLCTCGIPGFGQLKPKINPNIKPKVPRQLPRLELPEVKSITISPIDSIIYELVAGMPAQVIIELTKSLPGVATTVHLGYSSTPPGFNLIGPSSVSVPAGLQRITFNVTAPAEITADANGNFPVDTIKGWVLDDKIEKASINLRYLAGGRTRPINIPCSERLSIIAPPTVRANSIAMFTVKLECPASEDIQVQINSSNPALIPNATVTIQAGTLIKLYSTNVGGVTSNTQVTLTGHIENIPTASIIVYKQVTVTPF